MPMQPQFPPWLDAVSDAAVAVGVLCAALIAVDLIRRPQKMWIMNLVWPLTALFGGVLWLAGYFRWGRAPPVGSEESKPPFPIQVAKGASHCGAGCTLGDIIAEWLAFAAPAIALVFGWRSLFSEKTFAVWILDYLLAFAIGVAFQYFTIKPMRQLSVGQGLVQALKADVASITASPEFWFAMQLAMLGGFCTSYPANWALIRAGVKEAM